MTILRLKKLVQTILRKLKKLQPEPDYESRPEDVMSELDWKKQKVRLIVEGRML